MNKNHIIIGHLNINSVRNKFEELVNLTSGNIDIICISETKLDSSFPVSQFTMDAKSGGLLILKNKIYKRGYVYFNFNSIYFTRTIHKTYYKSQEPKPQVTRVT